MGRLIDDILTEIREKNVLSDSETHLGITKTGFDELLNDFEDEFRIEYEELGRKANIEDLKEYLSVPILIINSSNGQKYKILAEI